MVLNCANGHWKRSKQGIFLIKFNRIGTEVKQEEAINRIQIRRFKEQYFTK